MNFLPDFRSRLRRSDGSLDRDEGDGAGVGVCEDSQRTIRQADKVVNATRVQCATSREEKTYGGRNATKRTASCNETQPVKKRKRRPP